MEELGTSGVRCATEMFHENMHFKNLTPHLEMAHSDESLV